MELIAIRSVIASWFSRISHCIIVSDYKVSKLTLYSQPIEIQHLIKNGWHELVYHIIPMNLHILASVILRSAFSSKEKEKKKKKKISFSKQIQILIWELGGLIKIFNKKLFKFHFFFFWGKSFTLLITNLRSPSHLFLTRTLSSKLINNNLRSIASLPIM